MYRPQKPEALGRSRHSITLRWDAPADEDAPETSSPEMKRSRTCFILQKEDRVAGWTTVYTGFSATKEVKGLGPGKCYNFRLKHARQNSESPWSPVFSAATEEDQVPTTTLYRAIQRGQVQAVRKALVSRPRALYSHDRLGVPPLVRAVQSGDLQLVNLLLNLGAGVDSASQHDGRTALMTACFCGSLDVVRLLWDRGASWDRKDRIGCTPLHDAVMSSRLDVTLFAEQNGADIEAKDNHGWTPLMRGVVLESSHEVLKALLSLGAEPNCRDAASATCLTLAVLGGRADVVALLLAAGADAQERDARGHTALDMAAARGLKEIIPLLDPENRHNSEQDVT